MVELDHLFVMTDVGAPAADRLVELGLLEGSGRVHRGQGTANRRFFFQNAMLEFLWVHSEAEARSERTRRTRLWERWVGRERGPSPFGVALRPGRSCEGSSPAANARSAAPFETWEYRPRYLPSPPAIYCATDDPIEEPMWFSLPFLGGPDHVQPPGKEPMEHPCGLRELTGVRIHGTWDAPSAAARAVVEHGVVQLLPAVEHRVELEFDGGAAGRAHDLRPLVPLGFLW